MASAAAPGAIVPAQLGFLAIFNPSLGNTDDTIDDQIVYYASDTKQRSSAKTPRRTRGRPIEAISQEERHERLRQIGLAQGMINFSGGFADGASLDNVDTEKSRVITHELEPGWWILASINFTKVPLPPQLPTKSTEVQQDKYEYSNREMKPASLLLRDLLRAHSIFLLHHDTSLSALFVRSKRTRFVAVINRYWDLFLSTWNVMLHGNPVRNIFGGINIAASGELGVGVGEEDRGSGEREVLEGLVGRIEGLVDLVVCRFGTEEPPVEESKGHHGAKSDVKLWLGTGQEPAVEDGAVFLGAGVLSRKSVRDVTHWMEDLYQWGDHAYGVIDSPTSTRRVKRRANKSVDETKQAAPDTFVPTMNHSHRQNPDHDAAQSGQPENQGQQLQEADERKDDTVTAEASRGQEDGKLDKMLSYMKLGYGSYWTIPGTGSATSQSPLQSTATPTTSTSTTKDVPPPPQTRPKTPVRRASTDGHGHYLIGLKGEIEESADDSQTDLASSSSETEHNSRTVLRTVNVELEDKPATQADATIVKDFAHPGSILTQSQVAGNMLPGYNGHDLNKSEKLRVVVYVNRPFIFTFLFRLHTDSLAWDSLYRSLHHQLAPLKKSLLSSTNYRPEQPRTTAPASSPSPFRSNATNSSIYNLVWDPPNLTVHSTIPAIPESTSSDAWSRTDAINTHLHLLNIHGTTRSRRNGLERTQKTTRGWWIVWTRLLEQSAPQSLCPTQDRDSSPLPHSPISSCRSSSIASRDNESDDADPHRQNLPIVNKEIILIRRASDHVGIRALSTGDGGRGGPEGASKLVHGIGVDTRRYVEDLLSFL